MQLYLNTEQNSFHINPVFCFQKLMIQKTITDFYLRDVSIEGKIWSVWKKDPSPRCTPALIQSLS